MAYTPCYPNKRNWANLPSESSPINETNLNAMDNAIYTNDGRIVELSGRLDTDETALGNKVDKQSGKGLSEIKSITISPSVNTGTKIAEISYKNQDNLTIGYEIKNGVVVDSALSSSSENPVQNKVINTALGNKVDKVTGKGLSTNDYTTTEKNKLAGISAGAKNVSISDALNDGDTIANITIDGTTTAIKAKQPNESEMNVRSAMLLLSPTPIGENAPFVKRRSGGNVPFPALLKDKIIGASVVWSQLVALNEKTWTVGTADNTRKDLTDSVVANHVYYICAYQKQTMTSNTRNTFYHKVGTSYTYQASLSNRELSAGVKFWVYKPESNGVFGFWTNAPSVETTYDNAMCFDLTAMFNSTIADYVNTLETQTAGSGIAWLKSYGFFTEPYYAYSANKIESVSVSAKKYVGFNQWDEEWELGSYSSTDGTPTPSTNAIRSKTTKYISIFPSTTYYLKSGNYNVGIKYYDASKSYISSVLLSNSGTFTTPNNAYYIRFNVGSAYGTTYNNDICINISGSKNGIYEPYEEWQTALDHTTLRGLFKLDASNKLYADGDIYPSDGNGSVVMQEVDLGDYTWVYQSGQTYPFFQTQENNIGAENDSVVLCDTYLNENVSGTASSTDMIISVTSDGKRIRIRDNRYTDGTAFKTFLSGKKAIFKKATTTTQTLTSYPDLQNIASGGTEEFIDYGVSQGTRDVAIPVGGERQYYQGMDLPALPTDSGNHNLQFNPSSGFSWS